MGQKESLRFEEDYKVLWTYRIGGHVWRNCISYNFESNIW